MSAVGGAQRVDGLEAPLTGRDAELRTIRELFHAAVERRVPRLVLVSGPAGVGKSRLGWEFEKYTDGLAAEVWWHRGRCLSYGEGVAFWALAEIVRQRLGIAEEDTAEVAAAKLSRRPGPVRARSGRAGVRGSPAGPAAGRALPGGRRGPAGPGRTVRRMAAVLRAPRRRRCRSCCWSRTPSTPTTGCWTSSTTSSTGPGNCPSTCWSSPARSCTRPARGSAPGGTGAP